MFYNGTISIVWNILQKLKNCHSVSCPLNPVQLCYRKVEEIFKENKIFLKRTLKFPDSHLVYFKIAHFATSILSTNNTKWFIFGSLSFFTKHRTKIFFRKRNLREKRNKFPKSDFICSIHENVYCFNFSTACGYIKFENK